MSAVDRAQGPFGPESVAENYRRYLEPVLFAPWADRFVAWAGIEPGDVVLDLAAGTGAVARVAAKVAGSTGRVIAQDISTTMLGFAGRAREPRAAAITTLAGPAADLDLPDASVDVVLCQQGLPFMADRLAALRECVRVLRPGGVLAVSVWVEDEPFEPFDTYARAISGAGREVSNASVTMPLGDVVDVLHASSLREVAVTRRTLSVRWPTVDSEVAGVFGTPFGPVIDGMEPGVRERVLTAIREQLAGAGGRTGDRVSTALFGRGIR